MSVMRLVPVDGQPERGDLATGRHFDLDTREVSRVDGSAIWILIFGKEFGPFVADDYRFERWTSVDA